MFNSLALFQVSLSLNHLNIQTCDLLHTRPHIPHIVLLELVFQLPHVSIFFLPQPQFQFCTLFRRSLSPFMVRSCCGNIEMPWWARCCPQRGLCTMLSPWGSQSPVQAVASIHPCRVSSASCVHLLRVLFITGCCWLMGV